MKKAMKNDFYEAMKCILNINTGISALYLDIEEILTKVKDQIDNSQKNTKKLMDSFVLIYANLNTLMTDLKIEEEFMAYLDELELLENHARN